jgi:hypothetical protein
MNHTTTTGQSFALTVSPAEQAGDTYTRMTDPLKAVERLGEMIATSGMFGCTKVEQGQVLALQCMTERKAPLEMAKTYHVIEGKLSMRADAMLAKFQLSGGTVKWTRRDDKVVEATFTLRGNSLPFRATLEEFIANGVATGRDGKVKDNWRKFPRQMLTARVVSEAVRLLAPEVVFGVYTPEEIQDSAASAPAPEIKTVTPVPADPTPNANLAKLEAILEPHADKANAYLVSKGHITAEQNFRDMPEALAAKVINNPKAFVEAINK